MKSSEAVKSQYTVTGLQPGTRFKVKVVVTTLLKQLNVTLKQRLSLGMETAQCPPGWLTHGRSCYTLRRGGLTWSEALRSCKHLAAESHLADLKTPEDVLYVSSHLLSHNNLLLLWTGLNDQQPLESLLHSPSTWFRGVTVAGLSPGSVYSFTLRASHPTGSKWSLGQTRTAYTRPLPPQNITIGPVTVSQISVHWMLPNAKYVAGWTFVVRYVDTSSREERMVGMTNISSSSEASGLRSYAAVIGGLESYRKYMVEVYTVTQNGIESCGQAPVTVQTAVRAPSGLVVLSASGNLTVCWTSPPDAPPDGYYITAHPLMNPRAASSLWVNQSSPGVLWINQSMCVDLASYTPGQTYEIGMIALKGEDRSQRTTVIHTADPNAVEVAVPLSVGANSAQLYIQQPQLGLIDGVKVCVCPGVCDAACEGLCGYSCDWYSLPAGVHVVTISNLSPGSEYQLRVHSTSREQTGPPYYTRPIRTSLAPPSRVREGVVTDSSIELLWDPAYGQAHSYEVMCLNCDHSRMGLGWCVLEVLASMSHCGQRPRSQTSPMQGGAGCCGCKTGRWLQLQRERRESERRVTAGSAAFLTVTTARVQGVRVVNVSARAFSLRWEQAVGCVDHYQVSLLPKQGEVTVHPGHDGMAFFSLTLLLTLCLGHVRSQADVVSVSPGTQYTVTVTAASSTNIGPGVSRMIDTNESVPGPPTGLEGEAVGSNGILLSWTMPDGNNIDGYIIRYKEVCPYPDNAFNHVTKNLDIPETLLNDFTSGSTYHIQVAAKSQAGIGEFSKSLYIKTAESSPGLVTNLTAFAHNHTFVMVTWFLPHRINGLITKFAVKAKYARTGQMVRILEVNAEDIMTVALPHCNDAADILSRATLSPLEITASSPPITLSAVPPAASWSVPISVGVDQLRPYTAYLFEVSAFTSDGEGQIASTMVRMPESAPEDPPQNFSVLNMTSRSISVSWNSPNIITGKFTYTLYLYGPTGYLYENSTGDMRFAFTGLTPYTWYRVAVRARAAGEVGPAAEEDVITPAEAPSAVQDLVAIAEDSVSIRVSWRSPAQPNGPITQYRLQVLVDETLLQDITLTAEMNTTDLYEDETPPPDVHNSPGRRKRAVELSLVTSPPTFTATVSERTLPNSMTHSSFTQSALISPDHITNPDVQPTVDPMVTEKPSTSYASASYSDSTNSQSSDSSVFGTSAFSLTSVPPTTLPPWLTKQSHAGDMTSDLSPLALTSSQVRLSTRDASITGHFSTRSAAASGTTDLHPFTDYTFRVTASTTVGEGPASNITEKTREQVPSSVLEVSYQNISSTSIEVSWVPPLSPNGRITHYTVYGLKLHSNQALKWVTNTTSILIADLDKYTGYKLRVAASTAVGESSLSEEDDIFVYTLEDEPDSPPKNLTVVDTSPSTVTLTWSAPERANGVIQRYEVLYENESYSDLMNTSSNRVTLMGVKPFSYYNVSVRAYTRYGHGNQTSDTLYLLSGED
ncbi:phosphatidylinositol phosphatase PTPRQ, partial [Lates japonicus]